MSSITIKHLSSAMMLVAQCLPLHPSLACSAAIFTYVPVLNPQFPCQLYALSPVM